VEHGDPRRDAVGLAIERQAFQLVYQPIVDLDDGRVVGVEALSRFGDGRAPTRWFQECEALGLAAELDLAIITTALADLPLLPSGYLSLNVSPSTLVDPRLIDLVCAPGVPTERLVLEITEHAPVTNYGLTRQALDRLRATGVRLAVDDAGAGYATFRHVLRLHPDIIKMDMSITQHINEDPARLALATALVIFAGEIGAVVIAEGAETVTELAALQAAGVSRAQGFALARPQSLPLSLPADERICTGLIRQPIKEPAPGRPPWAARDTDDALSTTAHALLSPVGSIDIALELLRRKTEELGEDECVALIGSAQRQVRLVGGALQDLMRGHGPGNLVVLDGVCRTGPEPLTWAAPAD
jgi:EAL domain-containing protein (putative c-di-GMP-specific phosphodiesterase class I)